MVDKMREAILRWFEQVNRRNIDVPVRCEKLSMVGLRRGRPKKYQGRVIRQDTMHLWLIEDMT